MTDTILAEAPEAELEAAPEAVNEAANEAEVVNGAAPAEAEGADWRTDLAGEDDKLGKFLGKFPSLKDLAKAAKTANDKLLQRAGSKLPENPTDEEMAAYRTEHGIPDAPEGYLEKLSNGLVVGEDDRPAVDTFLSDMHAINAPKATVDAALQAYYKIVEAQQEAEIGRIAAAKEEGIQALRDEWGPDYKRNLNAVGAYLATLPPPVAEALSGGIDASGLPLASNPHVIQWIATQALEANPLNTVVPGHGASQASAVADEIAKWEGMMGDKQSEYWKGPNADKNQARLRDLYEAREKIGSR